MNGEHTWQADKYYWRQQKSLRIVDNINININVNINILADKYTSHSWSQQQKNDEIRITSQSYAKK